MRRNFSLGLILVSLAHLALAPPGSQSANPGLALMIAAAGLSAWLTRGSWRAPQPLGRPDAALAFALLLLALTTRLYMLEGRPAIPNTDEGLNGEIALEILAGRDPGPVLERGIRGEEASALYLHAWSFALLGPSIFAFRLPAALTGAFAVPLFFLLCRCAAGRMAAALTAGLFAIDPFQLFFSRMANTIIHASLFQCLAWLALWLAITRRRLSDFLLLGVALGLGLHTYPIFRLVPLTALALLLADAALRRDRLGPLGRLGGPLLTVMLILLFLWPVLGTSARRAAYLQRFDQATVIGRPLATIPALAAQHLAEATAISLGIRPAAEGERALPTGVALLALAALAALALPDRRAIARAPSMRPPLLPALLLAMLATGLAPPLIVSYEVTWGRRFLLMTPAVYLLAAIGLERLAALAGSRRRQLVVSALVAASLAPSTFQGIRTLSLPLDGSSAQMASLVSAARLSRERSVVISRSSVRRPLLPARLNRSPVVQFLLGAFSIQTATGLNPYPVWLPSRRIEFVLARDDWLPLLKSAHPEGRVTNWADPDADGRVLQLYSVDGRQALRDQGLVLSVEPTHSVARSTTIRQLRIPRWFDWLPGTYRFSGAIFLPESGEWSFRASGGSGPARLSLDGEPVATQPIDLFGGWFSEGWHPFELTMISTAERAIPPRFEWRQPEAPTLVEVPHFQFRRRPPVQAAVLAPRLAALDRRLALGDMAGWCWPSGEVDTFLQDFETLGPHLFALRPGANPLLRLDRYGKPDRGWKGLRTPNGRPVELAQQSARSRATHALVSGRPGDLYVADTEASRLYRVSTDGVVQATLVYSERQRVIGGMAFHPGHGHLLVSDTVAGQIVWLDRNLEIRHRWNCPGATAMAPIPGGRDTYVSIPRRGGIVRLDQEGRETAFFRMVDACDLGRLRCDSLGNLYALASRGRLQAFDPQGRVLLPSSRPLQAIPGEEPAGTPLLTALHVMPDNSLLIGFSGARNGWFEQALRPASEPAGPRQLRLRDLPEPWHAGMGVDERE